MPSSFVTGEGQSSPTVPEYLIPVWTDAKAKGGAIRRTVLTSLSDEELDALNARCVRLMREADAAWHETGDFSAAGARDYWWLLERAVFREKARRG